MNWQYHKKKPQNTIKSKYMFKSISNIKYYILVKQKQKQYIIYIVYKGRNIGSIIPSSKKELNKILKNVY